jgi:hypothetical protein
MSNDPLRQKIEALEANPDRGAKDTMNLAQLRGRLTIGEFTEKHPLVTAGMGALGGARFGATMGPGIVDAAQRGRTAAGGIGSNLKTLFGGG